MTPYVQICYCTFSFLTFTKKREEEKKKGQYNRWRIVNNLFYNKVIQLNFDGYNNYNIYKSINTKSLFSKDNENFKSRKLFGPTLLHGLDTKFC